MKNRLKLDWALYTSIERSDFVKEYVEGETFCNKPPTEEELETMGNYMLWGKNEEGKNVEQEGLVEIPRRYSTWSAREIESLDELTEVPTFNENSIYSLTSKAPTKKVREVFSREEVRKNAPASLLVYFEDLWANIDEIDLTINFYELRSGKRKNDPRKELLSVFTPTQQQKIREKASSLNQFKYLKMRHLLVELRREQYTLRDSYCAQILQRGTHCAPAEENERTFGEEIPVYPLGLINQEKISELLFKPFNQLYPENFSEEDLQKVSSFYWEIDRQRKLPKAAKYFDFTDLETVYELFSELENLEEKEKSFFSTTSNLLKTLSFYIQEADLTEVHEVILDLKIRKVKNQEIAQYVNYNFGKTYTANYISTIFRQKIIPIINKTAEYHIMIVGSLPFDEEFKKCTKCGRTLLRDPINFVRKSRAKDGLSNHCKVCDKKNREDKRRV